MRCWPGWWPEGLVKAGGKQRTDSTHVVAAVAALNGLELAGESVRAALEALAAAHPGWLEQRICVADFARRYGIPVTSWRPPGSQARRDELAIAYARDGYALLEAVYDGCGAGLAARAAGGQTCCAGCCCRTTPGPSPGTGGR